MACFTNRKLGQRQLAHMIAIAALGLTAGTVVAADVEVDAEADASVRGSAQYAQSPEDAGPTDARGRGKAGANTDVRVRNGNAGLASGVDAAANVGHGLRDSAKGSVDVASEAIGQVRENVAGTAGSVPLPEDGSEAGADPASTAAGQANALLESTADKRYVPDTELDSSAELVGQATGAVGAGVDADAGEAVDAAVGSAIEGEVAGSIGSSVQSDVREAIQEDLVTDIAGSLALPGTR